MLQHLCIDSRRITDGPPSLEDTKCAVRWMRECHAELGCDPDRIAVAGGSAGAHLSAMVALTPGSSRDRGVTTR